MFIIPYILEEDDLVNLTDEQLSDLAKCSTVMIQDEVADRLSAKPGNRDYGMISVYLGSRYNVKKLFRVSRNCFKPAPNVDSAVISLDKHNNFEIIDKKLFDRFIKDAFQYKRKNLKNNLKGYDNVKINDILQKYNYSLNDRAETIPVNVYVEIVNKLCEK